MPSRLAQRRLVAVHFSLYNLGAIVFLAGIPLAQARQPLALAAGASLTVLEAMRVALANVPMNAFSQSTAPARGKA